MRRAKSLLMIAMVGLGSAVFQSCPVDNFLLGYLTDCFGSDTISEDEYDDLNILEQLLWEENDCGRYERR